MISWGLKRDCVVPVGFESDYWWLNGDFIVIYGNYGDSIGFQGGYGDFMGFKGDLWLVLNVISMGLKVISWRVNCDVTGLKRRLCCFKWV